MGEANRPASDEQKITLEILSTKLEEVKKDFAIRLSVMQTEINQLKEHAKNADAKNAKRLIRITNLIDSTFDNFQQIALIFGDLTTRINECERRGLTMSNSISINKHNLNELSKYFKKVDKTWQQAIKEIERLKDSEADNKIFKKKILWIFTAAIPAIAAIAKSDTIGQLWDLFLSWIGL